MPHVSRFSVSSIRAFLACFLASASLAQAHPHVWVAYTASVRMSGTSIVALDERWRFTEGFPVQLVGVGQMPAQGLLDAALTKRFYD